MENLAFCSFCFNSFDNDEHKQASVISKNNRLFHICVACMKSDKGKVLMEDPGDTFENMKSFKSPLDDRQKPLPTTVLSASKKSMTGLRKKGLLDIIDRDNHHQSCGSCTTRNQRQRNQTGLNTRQRSEQRIRPQTAKSRKITREMSQTQLQSKVSHTIIERPKTPVNDPNIRGGQPTYSSSQIWKNAFYLSTSRDEGELRRTTYQNSTSANFGSAYLSGTDRLIEDYNSNPYTEKAKQRTAIDYEFPEHIHEAEIRETPFGNHYEDNCCQSTNEYGRTVHEELQPSMSNEFGRKIINPCPNHPYNEIVYLNKTERIGICPECVGRYQRMNHEILSLSETVSEVKGLIMGLEGNMLGMLQEKTTMVKDNKSKLSIIEEDRACFINEQQKKINQLHNYLDDKLRCIISEYDQAIEPDFIDVKNNISRLDEQIGENKAFISEIQGIRNGLEQNEIEDCVSKIIKTGKFLNYFNHISHLSTSQTFKRVYPNHLRDYRPVFEVNVEKELQIIANKFRVSSQYTPQQEITTTSSENKNISKEESQEIVKPEQQLSQVSSPVRRKIRIVRWLSKKLGEYDIDSDFWSCSVASVSQPFLAFSKSVYLPSQGILVLGGLNDEIPNKPTFSSQAILLTEQPVNQYDNIYSPTYLSNMISKRGCFSAVYHENYIFCFGGLNYTDKILRKSEKYSIAENKWDKIACLNKARKNSSACCLTSDTIYVFGGASSASHTDTIEQYSISADAWTMLKIKLPNAISFLSTFKLSDTKIMLLGGSARELTRKGNTYKTNQVLVYDIMKMEFIRLANLSKDVISLYPPFYDQGSLYLVDEDGKSENPTIIKYDI